MKKHAFFDLYLHSDAALEANLGRRISERVTLHEWPLSRVERIITTSGSWVYKTQRPPSLEAAFYDAARSDLLLAVNRLRPLAKGHTHLITRVHRPASTKKHAPHC